MMWCMCVWHSMARHGMAWAWHGHGEARENGRAGQGRAGRRNQPIIASHRISHRMRGQCQSECQWKCLLW